MTKRVYNCTLSILEEGFILFLKFFLVVNFSITIIFDIFQVVFEERNCLFHFKSFLFSHFHNDFLMKN